MAVYPSIASSTFRWFRLPTGHAPATLPCDAVEPPTTRQIGDSPTFDRIVIGGVQEPPHNNQWLVGWRPIRLWSEFIWARRILRSLFAITRMSSDEVQMKMSYQCPTSVLLLSDYLPVAPITLLLVTYQHYICVTNWNVSNQYPTKLVGSEKSTFRPASGQRPAGIKLGCDLCNLDLWPLSLTFSMDVTSVIGRRAGLLLSQQDFEWWWSVPLSSASLY